MPVNVLPNSEAISTEIYLPVKYVPWLLETYMDQKMHGCLTGSDCAWETKNLPVNVLSDSQAISPEIYLSVKYPLAIRNI